MTTTHIVNISLDVTMIIKSLTANDYSTLTILRNYSNASDVHPISIHEDPVVDALDKHRVGTVKTNRTNKFDKIDQRSQDRLIN